MPFLYALRCDGPECPREDVMAFDPQRGPVTPLGWRGYDGRTFCSHFCTSKYAAAMAEQEIAALLEQVAAGPVDALHPERESGAGEHAG